MRFYLIAGEASGDLHASILMKSLKKVYPNSEYRFFGGIVFLEVILCKLREECL